MSEPSSVYARINITNNNLNRFLDAEIKPALEYGDWLDWLKTINFSGNISKQDIESLGFFNSKTHKGFLDSLTQEESFHSYYNYNGENNQLVFSILLFDENILNLIRIMHIIRSIDQYKETDISDFGIIYPYMWLEDAKADIYIEISKGKSTIKEKIPDKFLIEANNHLFARREFLSQQYED